MATSVQELTRQAGFIFRGKVERLNAATMPAIPLTDRTAVARVYEVLRGGGVLAALSGQAITLQLSDTDKATEGQEAVFFTNVWLYGDSIAVREVGHWPVETAMENMHTQITDTVRSMPDEELQQHLAGADLVVSGKVSGIRRHKPEIRQPVSFHTPEWWEASLEVEAVHKGDPATKSVTVVFPQSIDIRWHKAPRFEAGQEGIWILHKGQIKGLSTDLYSALHPLDFHPRDQSERVSRLVGGPEAPNPNQAKSSKKPPPRKE
jgi:hypothetical protein